MCQLDWPQITHYCCVCLRGCFRKRLAFEFVNCPPSVGGHYPICWGLEQNKRWKEYFAPSCLMASVQTLIPCTQHPACQAFIPVLESISLARLVLRTQNKLTGFPVSPSCRQQMVGLLFFHNCMSRFVIINFSIHIDRYGYTSYWFCSPREPWLIDSAEVLYKGQSLARENVGSCNMRWGGLDVCTWGCWLCLPVKPP